jgi:hypothetical protein
VNSEVMELLFDVRELRGWGHEGQGRLIQTPSTHVIKGMPSGPITRGFSEGLTRPHERPPLVRCWPPAPGHTNSPPKQAADLRRCLKGDKQAKLTCC